ncbi:MAG: PDGLE domain-containing protein [Actinomycetota bacterium]|nr:PDGLE domain-containing protein [Actinomycetota bacterium]
MKLKIASFITIGLLISFFLATLVSPYASPHPDGLERVAENKGFIELAEKEPAWTGSPIPDYAVPGIERESIATGLAGLAGTAITFTLAHGLARILKRDERT